MHARWSMLIVVMALLVASVPAPANARARIVGGSEADASAFQSRWSSIAAVLSTSPAGGSLCGGVAIDPRTVLTAAHCTFGASSRPLAADQMSVVVGRRVATSSAGDEIPIASITRHPDYSRSTMRNDVAVLRLERDPQVPAASIQLTSLADESWWGAGAGRAAGGESTGPWIAGWGATNTIGTTFPSSLQQALVPIAADAACGAAWAPGHGSTFDASTMVCAGVPSATGSGGIDSCHGDSGGPLLVGNGTGEWRLVGLTSWGRECGGRYYGVYTRIGRFTSWIEPLRFVPSTMSLTPSSPPGSIDPDPPGIAVPEPGPEPAVDPAPRPASSAIGPVPLTPAAAPAHRRPSMPTRVRTVLTRGGMRISWHASRGMATPIRYRVLLRTRRGWRVRTVTRRTRVGLPRRWLTARRTFVRIQAVDRLGLRSRASQIVNVGSSPCSLVDECVVPWSHRT